MEHHLLRRQHLPPYGHPMVSSGFFNLCGSAAHFPCGGGCGFAAPLGLNDCGWAGDHMQLGGGVNNTIDSAADDNQARQCDGDGGPLDGPPPPSLSLDGDGDGTGNPSNEKHGVRELTSEPHRDDGNVLGTRKRRDRGKTIVLERKRRVRMQENLYELRALVPNITKMDKASIIADAVVYVKNLQSRAMKLKEEVAALEAPPRSSTDQEPQHDCGAAAKRQEDAAGRTGSGGGRCGSSHGARVAHVGATRVGEGRFLVTVECERRDGAAAHLFAAVESMACFRVESSSLGRAAPDRLESTFTLKATCQVEAATIGEGTVKLLMMAALGEEGFGIETTAGIS